MEPGPLYIVSSVKRLDPLMKNLLTDCSIQTVFSVAEIIPTVDQRALQKLHPYLLVPMLKELANIKLKKEVKTALLSCVNNILSRVRISSVLAVKNVLHSLMLEVFDKDSPSMSKDILNYLSPRSNWAPHSERFLWSALTVPINLKLTVKNISEEMKLSVMDCALSTITNMPYEVQEKFYTKENIPEICQIAYICLELAVSEKMRLLRIRAMEVVLALQQSPLDGPDLRSPWERKEIADIFQYILPGACSKLMTIVTGDITQGSKVLSAAIFTVSSMIALVMEDYPDCEVDNPSNMVKALVQLSRASDLNQEPKDFQENVPHNASGAKKLIESSQGRTLEWRKKIAIHLMPFLTKLGAQCEHSDPKICKVVATSCSLIILRCPLTLKECLAPLLDAVIALSVHENIAVKEESSNFLKKMAEYSADQNSHDFIQLAKENFYMLLTRLPRMVQREGGCNGAASLALVSGYVRLLHHSLHNILSSSVHLQRLTLSLLHVVTVECSSVNVASEHFTRLLNYEQYTNYCVPWIQLRFSPNRAVLTYMEQLFNILVEESVGTFDLIGSQLMDTLESVPHFKKESILLLNMLLLAAWNRKNYSACEMGVSLLDLYIAPDLELANDIGKAVTTISVVQESITLKCLVAEGISCCIQVMGKDRAQAHLLRSLYPLLELAGSANGSISLAGLRALSRVADVFGYNSNLVPLVSNNMDYLSHCMSIRLRHINNNLGVFDALSLILRHYSPEIALGLNSIVLNVLHQSSDVTQSKNNEAHLRVFLTFALGMQQWLKPKLDCSFTTSQSFSLVKSEVLDGTPSEAVHMVGSSYLSRNVHWNAVQKLKTYQTNLDIYSKGEILSDEAYDPSEELQPDKQPHNMVDSLNEGDLVDTALDKTDTTAELLRLLELILKRCLHFVPSPVVDHQFLAMKTLEVGLKTLHPFTNTLLPIVHLIWSPLVGRFEESQPPLVIRTAFKLLETMALTSKDFILSRTVRDIFPQLAKFLKHSVRESHLKDRASVYRFSQNYKTQVALLLGLGPLCCNLQLRGQDFYSLLSVCLPYLSSQQPRPLQVAAACSIRFLSRLDADAVWWALVSWWTPPHLALSLELLQSSLHQDCEENVKLLLGLSLSSKEEDIIGFSDLQN